MRAGLRTTLRRLVPRTLFGRLVIVLVAGLTVAQLLGALVSFEERGRALSRASGMQPAQRIADVVRLLDSVTPAERARIVAILDSPPRRVALVSAPSDPERASSTSARALMFSALLRAALGDERPVRVLTREGAGPDGLPPGWGPPHDGEPMPPGWGPPRNGEPMGPGWGPPHEGEPMGPHHSAMGRGRFGGRGAHVLAQVRLADGQWVAFDNLVTREDAALPWRLLATLGGLLAAVIALSYFAVRWITRPIAVLANAAEALGRDIHRPPLPEQGPLELRRAAHAFNTMQSRLVRFIEDRTRILAAMSHDLKTPITRMRLRADLLDDDVLRARFEKDLKEMEAMVAQTLDFMRGVETREPARPVDVDALLESLQADHEEMGHRMAIEGRAREPISASPPALKRCLGNLLDNAIAYGGSATVIVEDSPSALVLRIRDAGPGIPEPELERVFEPFYRLEASRSRETGGTGLGLAIARNIARAAGGDVRLANRAQGGLEATLTLPRREG